MNFTYSTKPAGVPAGAYVGTFDGYEEVPPNPEKEFGPGLKFVWTISEGVCKGQKACRVVNIPKMPPGPGNALGKLLAALKGGTVSDGENLDPAQWIGHKYTFIVQAGPNGGTRVETVAKSA